MSEEAPGRGDSGHAVGGVNPPAEAEPDARFTFANERTFLAWIRTAIALVVAGLAITQLLPPFAFTGGRRVVGLPLIALGAVLAFVSFRQWEANQHALRTGEPLPRSLLPRVLAVAIALLAAIAIVFVLVSHEPGP
jgi:putative membrane protein